MQRITGKAHRKLRNLRTLRNSPYLLQYQRNLLEGLQGRPIESYKNCQNYENCEICDNSPHHLRNQRNLFKELQGRPNENYEIYENCEIYDNSPYHLQNQRNFNVSFDRPK